MTMIGLFGSNAAMFFRAVDHSVFTLMMFWSSLPKFYQIFPRSVRQHSEIVIENVAAMYGAGFYVKGHVYISVGHSVNSLLYWGGVQTDASSHSHHDFNFHLGASLLTLRNIMWKDGFFTRLGPPNGLCALFQWIRNIRGFSSRTPDAARAVEPSIPADVCR